MKKTIKNVRLQLNTSTIRTLSDVQVRAVAGGETVLSDWPFPSACQCTQGCPSVQGPGN